MLKELLVDYGLSSKEAEIYLACLKLGVSPVGTIANHTKINRATVFVTLKNMVNKGVIKTNLKNNMSFYYCTPPKTLAQRLQQKANRFKSNLTQFSAIKNSSSKPTVQFFEGFSGIKEMYMLTLENEGSIRAFLNSDFIAQELSDRLYSYYLPARVKKGINARMIVPNSEKNKQYQSIDEKSLKETLIVPENSFDIGSQTMLFDTNKVATFMLSKKEMSGVVIESEGHYKSISGIFESFWNMYSIA